MSMEEREEIILASDPLGSSKYFSNGAVVTDDGSRVSYCSLPLEDLLILQEMYSNNEGLNNSVEEAKEEYETGVFHPLRNRGAGYYKIDWAKTQQREEEEDAKDRAWADWMEELNSIIAEEEEEE